MLDSIKERSLSLPKQRDLKLHVLYAPILTDTMSRRKWLIMISKCCDIVIIATAPRGFGSGFL